MLLRESLGLAEAAEAVEAAVETVLASGARTADLVAEGGRAVGTREMTDRVLEALAGQSLAG
jgi:3-isopropylmalate dehydrogenase